MKLKITCDGISEADFDKYSLAQTYFANQEYDRYFHRELVTLHLVHYSNQSPFDCLRRCVFYLNGTKSPVCKFLRYYAMYMSLEMKKILSATDDNLFLQVPDSSGYIKGMQELCGLLKIAYINNELDGFCLYVYGVVLKKLYHLDDAKDILIEAISRETLNWAAWQELCSLIEDRYWVIHVAKS